MFVKYVSSKPQICYTITRLYVAGLCFFRFNCQCFSHNNVVLTPRLGLHTKNTSSGLGNVKFLLRWPVPVATNPAGFCPEDSLKKFPWCDVDKCWNADLSHGLVPSTSWHESKEINARWELSKTRLSRRLGCEHDSECCLLMFLPVLQNLRLKFPLGALV